jgi:hypothetical protein
LPAVRDHMNDERGPRAAETRRDARASCGAHPGSRRSARRRACARRSARRRACARPGSRRRARRRACARGCPGSGGGGTRGRGGGLIFGTGSLIALGRPYHCRGRLTRRVRGAAGAVPRCLDFLHFAPRFACLAFEDVNAHRA